MKNPPKGIQANDANKNTATASKKGPNVEEEEKPDLDYYNQPENLEKIKKTQLAIRNHQKGSSNNIKTEVKDVANANLIAEIEE